MSLALATSNPAQGGAVKAPDSLHVPILVYHNIQPASAGARVKNAELTMRPEVFAEQMQYLKTHNIPVVSLATFVDALQGKGTLPPRAVVITFDDGRVNQYENAYPLLKKLGFPATFFPFTHAMDANPRYFTWAQLREMQSAGMTIGSHGLLHTRVDKMKDAKQMDAEIRGSRETLRTKLNSDAAFFSYPFGALAAAGDSAVRAAGYRAARAYTGKIWNSPRTIWRLNAVAMTENMAHFRQIVDPAAAPEPKVTSHTPAVAKRKSTKGAVKTTKTKSTRAH